MWTANEWVVSVGCKIGLYLLSQEFPQSKPLHCTGSEYKKTGLSQTVSLEWENHIMSLLQTLPSEAYLLYAVEDLKPTVSTRQGYNYLQFCSRMHRAVLSFGFGFKMQIENVEDKPIWRYTGFTRLSRLHVGTAFIVSCLSCIVIICKGIFHIQTSGYLIISQICMIGKARLVM